jgi:hypothetical protein
MTSTPHAISEPDSTQGFSLAAAAARMAEYLYARELEDAFEWQEEQLGECGFLQFLCNLQKHVFFSVVVASVMCDFPPEQADQRCIAEFRRLWDRYRVYLEDPSTLHG